MTMLYQVQISESKNGKIIRYETIATYHDFKNAYTHFIELLLNDDSELYNYRILEGNTVIEDAEDIKRLQAEGKMNVLWQMQRIKISGLTLSEKQKKSLKRAGIAPTMTVAPAPAMKKNLSATRMQMMKKVIK